MKVIFKTDQGKVRRHNEDNGGVFFNQLGYCLAIVADGMGGHNAGEIASEMAVTKMEDFWNETKEFDTPEGVEQWLRSKVELVNKEIFEHSQNHPECEGMGTTLVAAICTSNFATILNIGDSRCYLLNENGFNQLTEDHSFVNELVKTGQISPEDAESHPRKNMLLKAVGTEPETEMDIKTITLEEEDTLVLCSDGLSNKVSNEEMANIIKENNDLNEVADILINLANHYGGEDNISLAIIEGIPESRCEKC